MIKEDAIGEYVNKSVTAYLNNSSWKKLENANFNESFTNLQSQIVNELLEKESLMAIPEECANLHTNGDIHIHNLETGLLVPYCAGHNLKVLFTSGMKTITISSTYPKHLTSATDQIMNWLYMSQQEFAGAQAFADVDVLLAPYVKKDGMNFKEVKQEIQKLFYNLNYTLRTSGQSPFTNFTLDYGVPRFLKGESSIIDPAIKYDDCIDEIYMIDNAISEVMMDCDPNGKPFTFPILTINMTKEFPWNEEVADKTFEEMAVMGSYYFMNYVGSGINEDSVRSMCCRLSLDLSKLSGPRGLWNASAGTGSLGVVTVNFPRLGYLSKTEDEFYERLNKLMESAIEILLIRKERILKYQSRLMPFNTINGWSPRTYFLTIGVVGLNEMVANFFQEDINHNMDFVGKVICHMRDWAVKKQEEVGNLINIEMVPAEGCETPDTIVYSEEGFTKIGDYKHGTKLYNDIGELEEPLAYTKRNYDGVVYKIQPWYNFPFTITPEHPVLAKINIQKNKTQSAKYNTEKSTLTWVKAEDLRVNDVLAFPITQKTSDLEELKILNYIELPNNCVIKNDKIQYIHRPEHPIPLSIKLNKDAMFLFGMYIAEGSSTNSAIAFSLNSNEIDFAEKIKNTMKNIFGLEGKIRTQERHRMQIVFHSTILGKFLKTIFGDGAHNKKIPDEFITLRKDYQISLINALIDGDGNIDEWGCCYTTVSNKLASQLMLLLPRISVIPSIQYSKKRNAFKLCMYGESIANINRHANTNKNYHWNHGWIENNMLYVPIRKIESKEYVGPVFNFETSSNTYLNGCIVHNSSYRLAKIDKQKYPDIISLGTQETPYYTALLTPSSTEMDVFEKAEMEQEVLSKFTGGTIFRVFLGEKPDAGALKHLMKTLITKTKIPYMDATTTFSVCKQEGKFIAGIHEKCPRCEGETDIFSRVVGYIRPVDRWNIGKRQEFKDRKYFNIK